MKNFKIYVLLLLVIIVAGSCKEYKEEFTGAPLGVAPDDFSTTPLTASNSNPNFQIQNVFFQSDFSSSVNWTLTLKGQTSGATKKFEGYSKSLSAENTTWNGTTDTTKLFQGGETVEATLTVLGWDQTAVTSFVIVNGRNYGTVLATFEGINPDPSGNFAEGGYYWFSSFDNGNTEKVFMNKVADASTPQGNFSLRIAGLDKAAGSPYYIGKVGLGPSPNLVFSFPGAASADDFYINFYLKGMGTGANGKFVLESFENDDKTGPQLYDGTDDSYTYTILLNYEGWKFHSIKYSSMGKVSSGGNGTHEVDRIGNLGFFISTNSSALGQVEAVMDYIVITTNGPMVP